jgi:hypothetical protein
MGTVLEPDEEGLRLVHGESVTDVAVMKLQITEEQGLDVVRPSSPRQVHGPRNQRALLPVASISLEVEGVGHKDRFLLRPGVGDLGSPSTIGTTPRRSGGGGGDCGGSGGVVGGGGGGRGLAEDDGRGYRRDGS